MKFGEKLFAARTKKNLEQSDIADYLGVSRNSVSNWEIGKTKIRSKYIKNLCKILEVDENYFDEIDENPYPAGVMFIPAEKGQIPIIAIADAGPGIFSTDQGYPAGASDEWLSRPSGFKDINAYALRIPDGAYSMYPALKPGMIVVVSPNTECQSGDMAVVKFRDGSATIKEIHYKNGRIELRAYNSDYATRLVSPADLMFPPQPIVWWRRAK